MKNLVNLVKNGFERNEEFDFSDDGARFLAYEYNGIIVTKTTYKGEYFISIRVDYIGGLNYYDYKDKDWYKLADKYNGVTEVDVEDLKHNIDIIAQGVKELKEEIANTKIDWTEFDKRAHEEMEQVTDFINEHKMVDVMSIEKYELSSLVSALNSLKGYIESLEGKLSRHDRYNYNFFKSNKYITFESLADNYWVKRVIEITSKKEA